MGAIGAVAAMFWEYSRTNPNYDTDGIGVAFAVFVCGPIGAVYGGIVGYALGASYFKKNKDQ